MCFLSSRDKLHLLKGVKMIHLLWSLIVGFVVGLVARAIMPGAQHMGFLATSLMGIAGSLVGGVLGGLISKPQPGSRFHTAGFFLSLVGALIVLYAWIHLH